MERLTVVATPPRTDIVPVGLACCCPSLSPWVRKDAIANPAPTLVQRGDDSQLKPLIPVIRTSPVHGRGALTAASRLKTLIPAARPGQGPAAKGSRPPGWVPKGNDAPFGLRSRSGRQMPSLVRHVGRWRRLRRGGPALCTAGEPSDGFQRPFPWHQPGTSRANRFDTQRFFGRL